MIIMKFGGASLRNSQSIAHVAQVVSKFKNQKVLVVVSAMYGVTDSLISVFKKCQAGNFVEASAELEFLYNFHQQNLIDCGLPEKSFGYISRSLADLFENLRGHLRKNNRFLPASYDYVISSGERFSSLLVAAALNKINVEAKPVNASEIIIASNKFNNVKALIKETRVQARKKLLPLISKNIVPVVTGFFASTKGGEIVTLGRGGSDYSATILANVLNAQEVILWKEVDGVFSSDPKKNDQAEFYSELSYEFALSLARNGAKVLHPEAMKPVAAKGIVVRVKNTFNPDFAGTKIWKGFAA